MIPVFPVYMRYLHSLWISWSIVYCTWRWPHMTLCISFCCSCNVFPKIQKNFGTLLCLDWFDFLLWFDLMTLQKRLFLMPETIHFGFAFECVFKCLNRKFICLFSRHCGKIISFSLDLFLCGVCLNRLVLVFTSELFIAIIPVTSLVKSPDHWFNFSDPAAERATLPNF